MGFPYNELPDNVKKMIDREWSPLNQYAQGGQPCEPDAPNDADAVDIEIPLHHAIMRLCRDRGWVVFYSDPSRRTGRTLGEPDFSIYGHGGRHWLIECKAAKGKMSDDQIAMREQLATLGHVVHVVRSVSDFERVTGKDYRGVKAGEGVMP